MHLFNKII